MIVYQTQISDKWMRWEDLENAWDSDNVALKHEDEYGVITIIERQSKHNTYFTLHMYIKLQLLQKVEVQRKYATDVAEVGTELKNLVNEWEEKYEDKFQAEHRREVYDELGDKNEQRR